MDDTMKEYPASQAMAVPLRNMYYTKLITFWHSAHEMGPDLQYTSYQTGQKWTLGTDGDIQ
jgi:hypothetical protein